MVASYRPLKTKVGKMCAIGKKSVTFECDLVTLATDAFSRLVRQIMFLEEPSRLIHAEGASMKRIARFATTVSRIIVGVTCERAGAVNPVNTVKWVGAASGQWNDANAWKNTTTNTTGTSTAAAIFGQGNGSDGMNNVDPALTRARNIVINGGATVNYNGQTHGDFRIRQGSNLTVTGGATWVQTTGALDTDNHWTQMDASNLVLDNGTFRRTGEAPGGLGGGVILIGSYRGSANFNQLGTNSTDINITLKNGGKIENTGQVWFGAQEEHAAEQRVTMTINNGSLDLTGGTITQNNDSFDAAGDLQFYYDYDEVNAKPKNEHYAINFTGPGSITVDSAGIKVFTKDSSSIWNTGAAPSTYQDLWNLGILQANGLNGSTPTPANFNDFF